MKISSQSFVDGEYIPAKHTCDGANINPSLEFVDIPEGTESIALIVDDPDATIGTFVHWLAWNIDPNTVYIAENSVPIEAVEGITDYNRSGYKGPCPPSGTHRYFFKAYALDIMLDLSSTAEKPDLVAAMEGHILGQTEMVGLYSRQQ